MPVNWEEFDRDLDDAIDAAAEKTDQRLASKISSITRMTDDEIEELFPDPADVKHLAELMKIVQSSEARNTKVDNIMSNANKFGGIVLTLLAKFA